jgi:hypothetical protein
MPNGRLPPRATPSCAQYHWPPSQGVDRILHVMAIHTAHRRSRNKQTQKPSRLASTEHVETTQGLPIGRHFVNTQTVGARARGRTMPHSSIANIEYHKSDTSPSPTTDDAHDERPDMCRNTAHHSAHAMKVWLASKHRDHIRKFPVPAENTRPRHSSRQYVTDPALPYSEDRPI